MQPTHHSECTVTKPHEVKGKLPPMQAGAANYEEYSKCTNDIADAGTFVQATIKNADATKC